MDDLLSHYERRARRKVLRRSLRGRLLLGLEGLQKRNWSVLYLVAMPGDVLVTVVKFVVTYSSVENLVPGNPRCSKGAAIFILFLVSAIVPISLSAKDSTFIDRFIMAGSFFALNVSMLSVLSDKR
jgi:hypothetical protein